MPEKQQGAVRAGYAHDMSVLKAMHQALRESDITFAAYLPDTFELSAGKIARSRPGDDLRQLLA